MNSRSKERAQPNFLRGVITKVDRVLCPDGRRRVFLLSTPRVSEKEVNGAHGTVYVRGFSVSGTVHKIRRGTDWEVRTRGVNSHHPFF